MKFNFISGW